MDKFIKCIVCYVVGFGALYLAVGAIFGLGAILVAACIAWPGPMAIFGAGMLVGVWVVLTIRRLPMPTIGKLTEHFHAVAGR